MKVLLDTNILLDALTKRVPFFEQAETLFLHVANDRIEGYVTANSILDTYYIAKKHLGDDRAREAIAHLMKVFTVLAVTKRDCTAALGLAMGDFEDAVLLCCGARAGVHMIVSRDAGFQQVQHETVSIVSPIAAIERIEAFITESI